MVTIYINVKVSVELYSVVYFFIKPIECPAPGAWQTAKSLQPQHKFYFSIL